MSDPSPLIPPPRVWRDPISGWKRVLSHPWYRHLTTIRHHQYLTTIRHFEKDGFTLLLPPMSTGSISSPMGYGSDSMPVQVELQGARTYLADSQQFALEFGCRIHPQGVFYAMPCFRGEPTDSTHLPEFYHAECEIPGELPDAMNRAAALVHEVTAAVLETCPEELHALAGALNHAEALVECKRDFPRMRMDEALRDLGTDEALVQLHPAGFAVPTSAGEQELTRRHGGPSRALWLTHFHRLAVPFYQAREPGSDCAMNADLLLGGVEVVGAGQRHADADSLRAALEYRRNPVEPYAWYLELRDEYPLQTSGFGMGLERYLMWLLQHDDIRDLPLLHRENGRLVFP
ncbi:MAG: asparaginase [Flavobacteriaceae bacterium]|nr:MAG: asparaginase [Flavobacteriaceae bacterium]